jgi:RNA polymerase sigma factor (sigma-70 family)
MRPLHADALLRYVRRQVGAPDAGTDRALIQRFAVAGDEAAFTTLVNRHGPMVFRVCRRVLGNAHDAEDAFQATFLVLAKKAAALAWRESLAGWLHEVASRVALKARTAACRRVAHESRAAGPASTDAPVGDITLREAQALLNEELNRLAEKLRTPLVLCYLEGMTQDEAARQAGWSLSTLKRRLGRGLDLLQRRLRRRGVALGVVLSAAALGDAGVVSAALLAAATRAGVLFRAGRAVTAEASRGAALAEGLLRTMFVTRLRSTGAVLLAVTLAVAGGLGALHTFTERPRPAAQTLEAARRAGEGPAGQARAAGPRKLGTLRPHGAAVAVALSPDGKTLASVSGQCIVELWDVGRKATRLRATLRQAPDPRSPNLFQPVPSHQGDVWAVAFSPDGKTLASGAGAVLKRTPAGGLKLVGEVRLWDVATGKEKAPVRLSPLTVYSLAFSPDGKTLAWGGGVEPAAVDTTYRESFKDIPREYFQFKELGAVTVCDLATGKERTFFRGATGRIKSVAFSPDGMTLAAGGRDGAIRLFDVATGKERRCLREEQGTGVHAVVFSPDGKTLASVPAYSLFHLEEKGKSVKLWDLATGRVRARLETPAVWVHAVAFAADGRTVTTAGDFLPFTRGQGDVRLWDAATGRPRGTPLQVDHRACAVTAGTRGNRKVLAAAGSRGDGANCVGEITLWELDPRQPPAAP